MPQRNILLVDDHEASLRALARLLLHCGYQVREASSLAEAWRLAAQELPGVLVSDLELTDGDGCDLLRQLSAQSPDLCGIAVSGYDTKSHKDRCKRAGFRLLLVKPLVLEQLVRAIEDCPETAAACTPNARHLVP